jgi:hypothetical protein
MSCHGRMSDCQGVTRVIVHGSTAISAPPNAVGPDQSAGLYDKCMITPLVGTLCFGSHPRRIRRNSPYGRVSFDQRSCVRQSIDERAGQDEVEQLVHVRGDRA